MSSTGNRSLTCGKQGPRSLFRVPEVNAPTVPLRIPTIPSRSTSPSCSTVPPPTLAPRRLPCLEVPLPIGGGVEDDP
eukprot:7089218-Pyramimonas_sp.AAC.1